YAYLTGGPPYALCGTFHDPPSYCCPPAPYSCPPAPYSYCGGAPICAMGTCPLGPPCGIGTGAYPLACPCGAHPGPALLPTAPGGGAYDGQQQQSAHAGAESDDEGFMVIDPLLDAPADSGPLAYAVITFPAAAALGAVEEILSQAAAHVLRGVGGAEELAPVVAALVVLLAHEGLALLVTRCALPACAGQAVARGAAAISFIFVDVRWTRGCLADGGGGGELAGLETAVFGGGVADGVVLGLELACLGVAAGVVAAPGRALAAAITLLAHLDDAVAALGAGDGLDVAVVAQAVRFDGLAADGAADVADAAGGEVGDAGAGRGVHDEFAARGAAVGGERAALLCCDGLAVVTGGGVTVVDGAKGVSDFVGDN
ncbi:hypothetical protein V492_06383, partial [Pseudogymnoascus sp. VKM F-4246]